MTCLGAGLVPSLAVLSLADAPALATNLVLLAAAGREAKERSP